MFNVTMKLIDNPLVDLNAQDNCNFTILMNVINGNGVKIEYVMKDKKKEIVKKLIEKKVNLDLQDDTGFTALMHACENSREEPELGIIDLLIDARANVNIITKSKWTALISACISNWQDIAIKIINKSNCEYLEIPDDDAKKSAMDYMYEKNSTKVIEHLRFLYRNIILESIDDCKMIINNCFANAIGDINVVDIILVFAF